MPAWVSFFFFNDTATTEIYTLSLHDALPISADAVVTENGDAHHERSTARTDRPRRTHSRPSRSALVVCRHTMAVDRKSTRLNSSHLVISYAVFCLKKKKDLPPVPASCCSPPT